MVFLESLLIQTITIISPIIAYIIYEIFTKKDNKLISILLISNFIGYLTLNKEFSYMSIIINIPLTIMYLKEYNYLSIIILITNIFILSYKLNYSIELLILEYIIYIIVFKVLKNKVDTWLTILTIISIKVLFLIKEYQILTIQNAIFILITLITFYLSIVMLLYLLKRKAEIKECLRINKSDEIEIKLRNYMFKAAHEVKNPLAVCLGYLDMINLKDIEKTSKYIPIIKNEIKRSLTILDDTLNYSKIKIDKDIMDINLLIEEVTNTYNELHKTKDIEILSINNEEEILIEGDYNRLKQVMINLIKNSIESKKEGRNLKVRINVKKDKEQIYIIIKDNGTGMEKTTLENIGKEFLTTKKCGTGLGVCISQEIIKKHNGNLVYDSIQGKGTTVTIKLPVFKVK